MSTCPKCGHDYGGHYQECETPVRAPADGLPEEPSLLHIGGMTYVWKGDYDLLRSRLDVERKAHAIAHDQWVAARDRALAAEALTAELRKALDVASEYNVKNSRRAVEAEAALSQAKRLYEITLDNEQRWMRLHSAAEAALGEVRGDAERYRWLRSRMTWYNDDRITGVLNHKTRCWYHDSSDFASDTLDTMIDLARKSHEQ